jgi:3'-5' exoribonuclease
MTIVMDKVGTSGVISTWSDGDEVDAVLLVREVEARAKRDGSPFLRLVLGDRSATIAAVMWSPADGGDATVLGAPVRVFGRCAEHERHGRQVTVAALAEPEPDEVDWDALVAGPQRPAAALERELDELLASLEDPALAALMAALLGTDTATGRRFRVAPAAKFNHHAYRHGLLEHSVDVASGVSALSAVFGVDRDLALCGALLHDLGKLDAYQAELAAIDVTDDGRLLGEIPLGFYCVRRAIEDLDGFPRGLGEALLHIVLSHHGCLEHGSPVVPSTREAALVHAVDNLSGQMGAFDRLERERGPGERWSRFDRVLGAAAHFAAGAAS